MSLMRKCWINWMWLPPPETRKPGLMPWRKVGKSSTKEINITLAEKYSWETVDCYVQEPLHCDSDDEKHIREAVKESKMLKAESKKPLKPRAQLIGHSQQLFTSSQNSSSTRHKLDLSQHKGCFGC